MNQSWSWTSYKYEYTGHVDDPTQRCYLGRFRQQISLHCWETQRVRFWAHHPIAALRAICNSGEQPISFRWQIMN